jgi:PAS domain S-box-containing protein
MPTRGSDHVERMNDSEKAEQPKSKSASVLKRTTGELSVWWKKFSFLVRDATFTPEWLGSPWNHPIAAYLAAILVPCLTTLITYVILLGYPTFSISGTLPVLGVLIVAIVWGTGPGLISTLISAVLLNYFLLPPALFWSFGFQQLLETSTFLFTGLVISIIASHIEKVRAEAIEAKHAVEYEKEQLELASERLLRQRETWRAQETALLSANQQMANLISLSHDAIIVRTPEGKILSWNKGAENLYGWTAREAIGQITHDLMQTRFSSSNEAQQKRLAKDGRWEGQLQHMNREGSQVYVDSRQVMMQGDDTQPEAVLEINRDISEITRLNNEQAEAYARELSLRATKERMDEFLSIASHELRTPLTTIKGNLQLASMRLNYFIRKVLRENNALEKDLDEITTMLNRAERQVNIQNRLIRDLMDTTHIQVDTIELNMELCDLARILTDAVNDLRSSTPTRVIQVSQAQKAEIPVIADADRISQVITNYLTNALKYSPPESPIHVNLQCQGGEAHISVRDEGVGLTPEEQQHVWERFYQVKGNKRQKGFSSGLGLGLYICQAIIEEHGGEVGVKSAKGQGSTFWFTLPLADAPG